MLLKLPNTFRAFYGSFPGLHRVQQEACLPILQGRDLVVQAATGSGKSEAVLAPCLERVIQSGKKVAILYILPTRALAMDLKRRFEAIITERLGLNLALRTGDVKRTGGKHPDIMLTTPESLDVMLGSTNGDLKGFLFRVEMVIIDEVHAFLFNYRGCHLAHLFTRLERRIGRPLQKIAMSATISRKSAVIDSFGFKPSACSVITNVKRKIKARLVHIKKETIEIPALLNDLHHVWHYRKILIFVNSRVACDRVFAIANETGPFKGFAELHYSNLKPLERKRAEQRFRKRPRALCIATSTLELGIDVGDVDAVILYQPPGSVSAFLQRIGRSNRRGQEINFWGICSGERSSNQLIRFLALLELSESGQMESQPAQALPFSLPSVLSQQVISCLYEKKRVSLSSLQSLFPDQQETLAPVFSSLEKKNWLKPSGTHGLFGGGWQYRNHLLDYKIWGNFPEAEEDYSLEVSGRAIADVPQSTVSQMEAGDKIYLAGRLLRILAIDNGDRKRVLARPSTGQAEKQLAWIGLGPPVSRRVAKAMGRILNTGKIKDKTSLFSRTRILFDQAMEQSQKRVILENGIEIVQGKTALFRYRTFLGTMGNFVLEWSVREGMAWEDYAREGMAEENLVQEDLVVTSDETGIECSREIKFERLNLPVDRDAFRLWVSSHLKIIQALVSLNLFCKTLPRELLVDELMAFLFDPRVVSTFDHYLNSSSEIVSGDMATLFLGTTARENTAPLALDLCCGPSLLAMEKEKSESAGIQTLPGHFLLGREHGSCADASINTLADWGKPCIDNDTKLTITATMVSDYFFYSQCKRRFCLSYIGLVSPIRDIRDDNGLKAHFLNRGILHEKAVIQELKNQGTTLFSMDTMGSGTFRLNCFVHTIKEAVIFHGKPGFPVFISQGMLVADLSNQEGLNMEGVGIPDLVVVTVQEEKGQKDAVIQVGDIKSSSSPGYHHKWQVAFYALLLEKIITEHGIGARVAKTGFIITPGAENNIQESGCFQDLFFSQSSLFQTHEFYLKPYLAAVPVLVKTFYSVLSCPPALADHRLKPRCISCDWFYLCYHMALEGEDVQFLPGLTQGELLKLRQIECKSIAGICGALGTFENQDGLKNQDDPENVESDFTLEKKKKLKGQAGAFLENRIFLKDKNTRLFPNNISQAFFIHLIKDPLTRLPLALGYIVVEVSGNPVDSCVWIMENHGDRTSAWQAFAAQISTAWKKSFVNGRVPHIFYFTTRCQQDLFDWAEQERTCLESLSPESSYQEKPYQEPGFLWQTNSFSSDRHWTNLQQIFKDHFYLPIPGVLSLFSLAHVFGLSLELDRPPTLFHLDLSDDLNASGLESTIKTSLSAMAELYAKARFYLTSQWLKESETDPLEHGSSRLLQYLGFINQEHRLHQEDILTLQELTLEERMLKFRAIGHLRLDHTRLDHEGRFVHVFKTSEKTRPSKFRKGDFLRLAPHGLSDLQTGFPVILAQVDMQAETVSLISRSGHIGLSQHILYSLEEDISDWNQEKLTHVAKAVFKGKEPHFLEQLLAGQALERQHPGDIAWLEHWLANNEHGLNFSQQRALALPFQYRTSMIQGPPGTGKTHLLGWMLIALIMQAHERQQPLCIGVSALTHQAIDTVLKKVVQLVNRYLPDVFPGRCIKWGQARYPEEMGKKSDNTMQMEFSDDPAEVLGHPWLILGATGYGFYKLFKSRDKGFPQALDWVIFDEASQVPLPQALLSLIYSRGNFIFLGDVNQLPPIVRGNYGEYNGQDQGNEPFHGSGKNFVQNSGKPFGRPSGKEPCLNRSILANFLDIYPETHQETLDITYRMNKEICAFPGKTWYKDKLHPAEANSHARLSLTPNLKKPFGHVYDRILDQEKPVVLVIMEHQGCSQKSQMEADLIADLAHRLMHDHGVLPDQMALISPHRAQNNAIAEKLSGLMANSVVNLADNLLEDSIKDSDKNLCLPCVDTVERVQGAEREIIIFGMTSSDPDHLSSEFLNSPNRLNVAMTRAKTKLIIIGSQAFFSMIPDSESLLEKNACFKAFLSHCEKQDAVFTE